MVVCVSLAGFASWVDVGGSGRRPRPGWLSGGFPSPSSLNGWVCGGVRFGLPPDIVPPGSADVSNGLSHRWRFDGDGADSVGSQDLISVSGCGYAGGVLGSCVVSDGGDNAFVSGGAFVLQPDQPWTLSMWVRPSDAGWQALIYSGDLGSSLFLLQLDSGDVALTFGREPFGEDTLLMRSVGGVVLNSWNHVVLSHNGGPSPSDYSIYVNGARSGVSVVWDCLSARSLDWDRADLHTRILVGGGPGGSAFDDLRFYSRELPPDDVLSLYTFYRFVPVAPIGPVPVIVYLNPGDGYVEPSSLSVVPGASFGELPCPCRDGFTFGGWFDAETGAPVYSFSTVTFTSGHWLYAWWY